MGDRHDETNGSQFSWSDLESLRQSASTDGSGEVASGPDESTTASAQKDQINKPLVIGIGAFAVIAMIAGAVVLGIGNSPEGKSGPEKLAAASKETPEQKAKAKLITQVNEQSKHALDNATTLSGTVLMKYSEPASTHDSSANKSPESTASSVTSTSTSTSAPAASSNQPSLVMKLDFRLRNDGRSWTHLKLESAEPAKTSDFAQAFSNMSMALSYEPSSGAKTACVETLMGTDAATAGAPCFSGVSSPMSSANFDGASDLIFPQVPLRLDDNSDLHEELLNGRKVWAATMHQDAKFNASAPNLSGELTNRYAIDAETGLVAKRTITSRGQIVVDTELSNIKTNEALTENDFQAQRPGQKVQDGDATDLPFSSAEVPIAALQRGPFDQERARLPLPTPAGFVAAEKFAVTVSDPSCAQPPGGVEAIFRHNFRNVGVSSVNTKTCPAIADKVRKDMLTEALAERSAVVNIPSAEEQSRTTEDSKFDAQTLKSFEDSAETFTATQGRMQNVTFHISSLEFGTSYAWALDSEGNFTTIHGIASTDEIKQFINSYH